MKDVSTVARLLLAQDAAIPILGRGFRVLCSVRPFPSPDLPASGTRKIGCRPCLFLQQEGEAGILAHFLFALSLSGATETPPHDRLLFETEAPPFQTIWLDPCPATLSVRPRFVRFSFSPSTSCLAPLWTHLGPPDASGRWLASRLLPPLVRPAVFRHHSPSLLHLWIRP